MLLLIVRGTELSWRALLNALHDMVVHMNFIWTTHRFADHIIQYRFGTINPQSAVNVNRPQGSRSPTRPDLSTPIQPSWPAFHRSPSSTRYPRLSEVMKVHVSNIPIPINAEITRCIKVQDVFHLKVRLNPITSGVELHQNHTKRAVLSWHYFREILYFASEVLGFYFTWFRCKASKQHSDNRLIYQRTQCSQLEYITGMPWI